MVNYKKASRKKSSEVIHRCQSDTTMLFCHHSLAKKFILMFLIREFIVKLFGSVQGRMWPLRLSRPTLRQSHVWCLPLCPKGRCRDARDRFAVITQTTHSLHPKINRFQMIYSITFSLRNFCQKCTTLCLAWWPSRINVRYKCEIHGNDLFSDKTK